LEEVDEFTIVSEMKEVFCDVALKSFLFPVKLTSFLFSKAVFFCFVTSCKTEGEAVLDGIIGETSGGASLLAVTSFVISVIVSICLLFFLSF